MSDTNFDRAMDRIRDEAAKEAKRPEIGSVGEVMTELLRARPDAADAILEKGKTLAGAYAALEKYARDHRNNRNCVYLGPDLARRILREYYGIPDDAPVDAPAAKAPEPPKAEKDAAFDLDSLMAM